MKKYILFVAIMIAIALTVSFGVVYFMPEESEKTAEKSTQESIAELFSQKYNKSISTLIIDVKTDTGTFAKGSVNFTDEMGGGLWFAAKTGNGWELAFDGNGIVSCEAANKYNFPKDMIPQCIETQNGNKLIER